MLSKKNDFKRNGSESYQDASEKEKSKKREYGHKRSKKFPVHEK